MNKLYIRYGEIPPDEKSKIYNKCDNSVIGEEVGVSVFEYIEGRGIVIPDTEKARDDFFMLSKVMKIQIIGSDTNTLDQSANVSSQRLKSMET